MISNDIQYMHECSVTHLCLILCDAMDYGLPGSSVHGISQGRVLEWVAISSSMGSSRPGEEPESPGLASGFFTTEPPGKSPYSAYMTNYNSNIIVEKGFLI